MFVFYWSLISPLCLCIVAGTLSLFQKNLSAGYPNLGQSIVVYGSYWLLLAMLQGAALFWKFQDRKLAIRWAQITAITGSIVTIAHDLALLLLRVNASGQGFLILLLSLPCLALIGSPILGAAQLTIVRQHYRDRLGATSRNSLWLAVSFIAWAIGFGGIFVSLEHIFMLPLFVGAGTAWKGWFIYKYLNRSPVINSNP